MPDKETQLAAAAQAGDASAFSALYAARAGRVKAYFRRSGFADADADDLTQETFRRAWSSLASFDAGRGRFAAWLFTIARNVARRQFQRRADARDFDPQLAEQTLVTHNNPGDDAEVRERLAALDDCIGELPQDLADVVRLRYVEARTTRGVATAAGLAEATARLRLSDALAALARCLKSKGISA
jgi:RNA polymerase sigma-70 factor (ECF subfamily)